MGLVMKKTFNIKKTVFTFILCFILPILASSCADDQAQNTNDGVPQLETSIRCVAITAQGVRCKNMTKNADGYCHVHRSQAPKK